MERGEDVSYVHGLQDLPSDHAPAPIPMPSDYLGRCDFCNGGIPVWVVPARDFLMPHSDHDFSSGDWAACDECAPLIERNDWNGLVSRVVADYEHRHGSDMADSTVTAVRGMYRLLRKNITGPLRLLHGQDNG